MRGEPDSTKASIGVTGGKAASARKRPTDHTLTPEQVHLESALEKRRSQLQKTAISEREPKAVALQNLACVDAVLNGDLVAGGAVSVRRDAKKLVRLTAERGLA